MAINDIFEIGRQGIEANRRALSTTSQNVSNANTPGYSRQRANFSASAKSSTGGVTLGGGVQIDRVVRVHNDFVHGQILEEMKSHGGFKARAEGLTRIEGQVNEQGRQLSEQVTHFFNAFRELSTNPEQQTLKLAAIQATEDVGRSFRKINDALESLKKEIDINLGTVVDDINHLTREVASLNQAIALNEAVRDVPNELLDRRELILRQLSSKLGFQTFYDERGAASVVSGGAVLVQGSESNELTALRTPEKGNKGEGSVEIMLTDKYGNRNIPVRLEDGELGGAIHIRDNVINVMLRQLDTAAYQLGTSVNKLQEQAVELTGNSSIGLFTDLGEQVRGSASRLGVSQQVRQDPEAFATGLTVAPGDNRVVLEISSLAEKPLMPEFFRSNDVESRFTIGESINSLMGFLGSETQRERQFFESSDRVLSQLENYRESISGVSLEEEAINMIQYQHAFNAAAKATKVGDELLQTILSIKE